jgi:ATP/maltotriose-dependent transcriptional regulator MalT/DNA-binding SARP family transcriptional activator
VSIDPVVRARLRQPGIPADAIERPALIERIRRGLDGPMVAVIGDAGYGKSTALAQAVARGALPVVWISCDPHVGSPSLLMAHVVAGVAARAVGVDIRALRERPGDTELESLAGNLARRAPGGMVIVFDDVHALPPEVADALGRLASVVQPSTHLAFASRPALPESIAELVTARGVVIGEEELVLAPADVVELAWRTGAPLDVDKAADLHRRTRGWPAGVVLALQAVASGVADEGRGFERLVEQVFLAQPDDVREFLLATSVMDRFTAGMARRVSNRADTGDLLAALRVRGLFGTTLDAEGEWYRYHQLFQASLRQRLARGAPERLADLHRRAGRAWLAAGEPVEGIHHLLAGGDAAEAAAALEPLAEELAHTAEAETLAGWLEAIPAGLREGRPGLILAEATLLFGRGDYEASSACIERAMEQLLAAGEDSRAGLAFLRLLQVALAAGVPERGPGLGERWLARLAPEAILPATRIALRSCYAWAVLRQPADIQEFLLATAVLDRFTAEMAGAVSGRADAERVMTALAEASLFTVIAEPGGARYRHHQLFRTFLRQRLTREDPERLAELHRRAAAAWLAGGEPAAAVPHLLQAGEHRLAAEALEPLAEEMAHTSEAETLVGWLEAIPEDLRWRHPGLVMAEASLLFDRGACEAYFGRIERAMEQLLAAGRAPQAATVLSDILLRAMVSGVGAERAAASGGRLAGDPDMPLDARAAFRLLAAVGNALCGRFDEARENLRTVASDAPEAISRSARALGAVLEGVVAGRADAALRALDDLGTEAREDIPFLETYADVIRIRLLNNLGRHEEAIAAVNALTQWEPISPRRGAIHELRAWEQARALAGLERWDELEALISPGPASSETDAPPSQRLRAPAALLAAARRNPGVVAMHVTAASVDLADQDVRLLQPEILCDLALAAWRAGLFDQARHLAEDAGRTSRALGLTWPENRAALLGAAIVGPGDAGDELLATALGLTGQHGHQDLWTSRDRALAARLLVRALERSLGPPGLAASLAAACGAEVLSECVALLSHAPPEVRVQLAQMAGEAPGVDAELLKQLGNDRDADVRRAAARSQALVSERPRPPIRFVGLGGFAVWRGDETVPHSAFGRQRARALLAALLCAGRPVHREELLDWFWSGLDAERGLRALHVTLYGLRRALEPELPRGAASSVVFAEGESYRMRLEEGDTWDVADFLELARQAARLEPGEGRLAALRRTEGAYAGPLFPEWPYERWSEARRLEVTEALRTTLALLAEELVEVGAVRDAIARYERLTVLEPEREAWHRALMVTYQRAGERALALRQYHACRKILREELGVETSTETRELHRAILNGS